jgi:hypothetical protein
MRKEKIDSAESDMVEHLRSVDNLVHYIAAKRISEKRATKMTLDEWDKIYDRLLRFVGTAQAKKLIEMGKS